MVMGPMIVPTNAVTGKPGSSRHFSTSRAFQAKRDAFRLSLSSKWFVVCWWIVFVVRSASIVFLSAMTWLYRWLLTTPRARAAVLGSLNLSISYDALDFANLAFALLNAIQFVMLMKSLFYSFKARELAFKDIAMTFSSPSDGQKRWWLVRKMISFKRGFIEPVLYLHGEYFDYYFLVREFLEAVSQIYQGYLMSVYIATRWINDLYVGILFLNCISTPLIHRWISDTHRPLRRLLSVICSTFLNSVNAVVIPTVIFLPYVRTFDTTTFDFNPNYVLDDVWYAKAVRENQQVFVTSYLDFWTTWMLHWSLFSCLFTCEDLIRREHWTSDCAPCVAAVVPCLRGSSQASPCQHQPTHSRGSPTKAFNHERLLYRCLWISGVVVLGVHIAAQSPQVVPGCRLTSTPWLATKSSCIIMNVNCYRRGIDGHEQDLQSILQGISAKSLFQLLFTHCPQLQVPSIIRSFCNLGGLDIYNCTIHQWDSTASLHRDSHPSLNYVYVFRSHLAGIPAGLMDKAFPDHVSAINFYGSNLSSLPDNLHESWSRVTMSLDFEFCQFEEYPATINAFAIQLVAFTGNPLQLTSPPSSMSMGRVHELYLSNTSLLSLPSVQQNLDECQRLMLEYTKVMEVPLYLRQWFATLPAQTAASSHSLFGSPYCNRTIDDVEEKEYQRQVCCCDQHSGEGFFDLFNVGMIDAQRAL